MLCLIVDRYTSIDIFLLYHSLEICGCYYIKETVMRLVFIEEILFIRGPIKSPVHYHTVLEESLIDC